MPRGSGLPVTEYSVYLHLWRKRPKKIDSLETDNTFPNTWEHDGHTYFFVCADLIARTITYSDARPGGGIDGGKTDVR